MKTPRANPVQRHIQAAKDCQSHLAEITTKLDELANRNVKDWNSVGELNRLRFELGQIADRLMQRGEYAE